MLIKYAQLSPDAKVAQRASSGAVGYDVYAYRVVDKNTREECGTFPAVIEPGESILIGTGIIFAVPFPIDCQVRPRSGLASKYDVELSNSPGTIDPDYRGEAGILLRNRGRTSFTIEKGMRVAQLIFTKVEIPVFLKVDINDLPPTSRARGGFGSTGLNAITLGADEYLAEQKRWDRYFMRIANSASELSNCLRGAKKNSDGSYKKDSEENYVGTTRKFGCVIVKGENIVATGFNTRTHECDEEHGCIRERLNIRSGLSNDVGCRHAEEVALQNYAQTGGPSLKGTTVYVNAEPCVKCAKLLAGCGIDALVVPEGVYPENGLKFILDMNIEIRHVKL